MFPRKGFRCSYHMTTSVRAQYFSFTRLSCSSGKHTFMMTFSQPTAHKVKNVPVIYLSSQLRYGVFGNLSVKTNLKAASSTRIAKTMSNRCPRSPGGSSIEAKLSVTNRKEGMTRLYTLG